MTQLGQRYADTSVTDQTSPTTSNQLDALDGTYLCPSMQSDLWALGCVMVEVRVPPLGSELLLMLLLQIVSGVRVSQATISASPPDVWKQQPIKLDNLSIHPELKQLITSCWSAGLNKQFSIVHCVSELRIVSLRTQLE